MSKYTPGKWKVLETEQNGYTIVEADREATYSLAYVTGPITRAERLANARLIAAAPDMLKALKRVKPTGHRAGDCYSDDYMGKCVCGLEIIQAAIAKAEGK